MKSGFASIVGRPNVGKSTLTNALVGDKVAITSPHPQTTRHAVRGIVHRPDAQIVLVDTPGLHRPRTLLGERLNDVVRATWANVDVIALCVPADEDVGPGDRFLAAEIGELTRTPKIAVVTKADAASRDRVAQQLSAVAELGEWADIVPVSAATGYQLDVLADLLAAQLPTGQALYPADERTDEPDDVMIAELIREASLDGVREELPHSIAVTIDEMRARDDKDLTDVHATIHVERDSQKGIVIGKGGERLKNVGATARPQIEKLLGTRVFLDLHVRVAKDWQRDPKQLRRLGF